jgi:hypothetical protein
MYGCLVIVHLESFFFHLPLFSYLQMAERSNVLRNTGECCVEYEGCSESNAPHFFSHSIIKIAMLKLRGSNTDVYWAHVLNYTVIQQIALL